MKHGNHKPSWILLLLADGFDEAHVATLVHELRSDGLPVRLVGLLSGAQRSTHGLQVLPDVTLETMNGDPVGMIILPGGAAATARLHSDPRVRRLLTVALETGKPVALSQDGLLAFRDADFLTSFQAASPPRHYLPNLLMQGGEEDSVAFARSIKRFFHTTTPVV